MANLDARPWEAYALSIAVFVGTTVLSQWAQKREGVDRSRKSSRFVVISPKQHRDDDEALVRSPSPTRRNWNHFERYHPRSEERRFASEESSIEGDDAEETLSIASSTDARPPLAPSLDTGSFPPDNEQARPKCSLFSIYHAPRIRCRRNNLPQRVILVRHGQSLGNIDESLYATIPDNAMPLTEKGWQQATAAGNQLRSILPPNASVRFLVSPYVRTMETFHGICHAWCPPVGDAAAWHSKLRRDHNLSWRQDPRLREQDFGNFQDSQAMRKAKAERARFGSFYYRFPNGESGSDVYDRLSTFLDSLWRSFDNHPADVYVIVTHGICLRILLMRYFRYTVEQFHVLANPTNAEMFVLGDERGKLEWKQRYELVYGEYKEEKRLRVLPESWIHKVVVRNNFVDGE